MIDHLDHTQILSIGAGRYEVWYFEVSKSFEIAFHIQVAYNRIGVRLAYLAPP